MKRIIAVVVMAASVLLGASAAGANPGCVTQGEFDRAHLGLTVRQVTAIYDTSGVMTSFTADGTRREQTRKYNVCRQPNVKVLLTFGKTVGYSWSLEGRGMLLFPS